MGLHTFFAKGSNNAWGLVFEVSWEGSEALEPEEVDLASLAGTIGASQGSVGDC